MTGFRDRHISILVGVLVVTVMLGVTASSHADDQKGQSHPSLGAAAGSIAVLPAAPAPSRLQNLRTQQKLELKQLRDNLRVDALRPGADVDSLKQQYIKDIKATRDKFLSQDTRTAEIKKIETDSDGAIKNTGSNPKDVRADVDLAAKTHRAADDLVQKWQARGDVVEKLPEGMGYVNKTTDTTLWNPCETQSCLDAKIKYYDSFGTPGGRAATGNTTEPGDAAGFGNDNQKKFEHAYGEDDLKTAAKSVDKAADAARTKDPNDPFYKQAQQLREYADPVEAGIADPADSANAESQKVKDWLKEAQTQLDEAVQKLKAGGRTVEQQREEAIERLRDSSDPEDQALAEQLEENIQKINKANAATEQANLEARNRNNAGDTHTSDADRGSANSGDTDNAGGAAADSAAGAEAAKGALAAAVAQFMACAAQIGIDRYEYTQIGAQTIGQCFAQVASLEGVKGISEGALWGAIAASGPAGALIAAAYGAGAGTVQIGKAGLELGRAGGAINEMWQNETNQQQTSRANCADTDAFRSRLSTMDALLKGFDADCSDFDQVCQEIIGGSYASGGQSDRARELRTQLAGEKSDLNVRILSFTDAYSACPDAQLQMIKDQLLTWTGRFTQSASVLDRNPNCGSSAPAGQAQNVADLMNNAQDPNSNLDFGTSTADSGAPAGQGGQTDNSAQFASQQQNPAVSPAAQTYAGTTTQTPPPDTQEPTAADWLTAIGAGLTGFANGVQSQNNAMAPAQQTYYPAPGYYNPAPRYNSSSGSRAAPAGNPYQPANTVGTPMPAAPQCPAGYSYQAGSCVPLHTGCPPGKTPVQEADGRWCSDGMVEQPCRTDPCW